MSVPDICASQIFSNQTICEVIRKLDDLSDQALLMRDLATDAIDAMGTAADNAITSMQGINYAQGSAAGVNQTYVAPDVTPSVPDLSAAGPTPPTLPTAPTIGIPETVSPAPVVPSAYTVPSADSLLISAAVFDSIFNREADRLAETSVKREKDAVYRQSSKGIGMAAAALTMGLAEAEEETNLATSDVARDKAMAEGSWLRDDAKTLHDLHVQNWPLRPRIALDTYQAEESLELEEFKAGEASKADIYTSSVNGLTSNFSAQVQLALGIMNNETSRYSAMISEYQAQLAAEGQRRGWSELQTRILMEDADKLTQYSIAKAQYLASLARETEQAIAQLLAGITQAIYSAASYHLGGSGSQSVTE